MLSRDRCPFGCGNSLKNPHLTGVRQSQGELSIHRCFTMAEKALAVFERHFTTLRTRSVWDCNPIQHEKQTNKKKEPQNDEPNGGIDGRT